MTVPVLTIDGPSGAGKGTVSRAVARKLDWNYLDSGSIYRSLAVAALVAGVDINDELSVTAVAEKMKLAFDCGDELTVFLNGENITSQLPLESTAKVASIVAAWPEVRRVLLQKQRDFKVLPGLVADGRDMGTVVFPEATIKVFLTASAEERALRRYKQLKEKGIDANLAQITCEIEERDRRDSERASAPLKIAEDAVLIDSSSMSIESVIAEVLAVIP
ncbi:(d)CMP kinase [Methylicorpusculum sp.]|uniref:(d)CMP kinase n=1 Tax=Methylicorpusculum sp. TaxID=2713644 RepID=UPI002730445E|nr:(d)CMP kinase [Methylicorpusculum sp.]MDP2180247.1 (d)CMP kinase [Methylicorpusculum sp.]MDP3528256.1 (d)CMP kinase [Methylicorpusculum sp.]MDZ4152705.1 (d)CMP kinase [Methylicorpusculum sp.]